MSKLIDKLDKLRKGNPTPMGFGAAASREKMSPMLLIGLMGRELQESTNAQANGQWDAVLLKDPASSLPPALSPAKAPLANTPWGCWPRELTLQAWEKLVRKGCDFLVFPSEGTPLEALEEGETGRVLAVPLDMPDPLLRTLDDLPIDAVLVSTAGETFTPLTLQHLMQIGVIGTMTCRYLLLELSAVPDRRELECLRDTGVDALVLDAAKVPGEELKQTRHDLLGLPHKKPRAERASALLPHQHGPSLRPRREEEGDEEEGEEEGEAESQSDGASVVMKLLPNNFPTTV